MLLRHSFPLQNNQKCFFGCWQKMAKLMKLNESNPYCDCHSTKALFHTEMAYWYFFSVNSDGHFVLTICFLLPCFWWQVQVASHILPCHCCLCVCVVFSFQCSLLIAATCFFVAFLGLHNYFDKYTIMHKWRLPLFFCNHPVHCI